MTRSHKVVSLGSLGEGAAGGAPLLPVSSSVVGFWLSPPFLLRCLSVVCLAVLVSSWL